MKNQKGFALVPVILVLIIAGMGIWFLLTKSLAPDQLRQYVKDGKIDRDFAFWLGKNESMDALVIFKSNDEKKRFLNTFSKNDYILLEDYGGFETAYITIPNMDAAGRILSDSGVVKFSPYGWAFSQFDVKARAKTKAYRDDKYGYEVKTSNFYAPIKKLSSTALRIGDEAIFQQISVFDNQTIGGRIKTADIQEILKTVRPGLSLSRSIKKSTVEYYLGGKKGKAVIFTLAPEDKYTYILVEKDNKLYEFFTPGDLKNGGSDAETYSTFKFIK
ncbi:MAG: hypothetical protein HYX21_02240 [Candidatus Yanofskybacteria bacterium]|nr:hypothetical protein [Candidatus Yanofskybacteria bacterium]